MKLTKISKAKQIEIPDERYSKKAHCFRFYKDGHVTYNQRIQDSIFYKRWQRVNMKFGYAEYLKMAKHWIKLKETTEERI